MENLLADIKSTLIDDKDPSKDKVGKIFTKSLQALSTKIIGWLLLGMEGLVTKRLIKWIQSLMTEIAISEGKDVSRHPICIGLRRRRLFNGYGAGHVKNIGIKAVFAIHVEVEKDQEKLCKRLFCKALKSEAFTAKVNVTVQLIPKYSMFHMEASMIKVAMLQHEQAMACVARATTWEIPNLSSPSLDPKLGGKCLVDLILSIKHDDGSGKPLFLYIEPKLWGNDDGSFLMAFGRHHESEARQMIGTLSTRLLHEYGESGLQCVGRRCQSL